MLAQCAHSVGDLGARRFREQPIGAEHDDAIRVRRARIVTCGGEPVGTGELVGERVDTRGLSRRRIVRLPRRLLIHDRLPGGVRLDDARRQQDQDPPHQP